MPRSQSQFAVFLITSLFFFWSFALSLNLILIPYLKEAFQLTYARLAFIDLASYIAYFLLAIPAGQFLKQISGSALKQQILSYTQSKIANC